MLRVKNIQKSLDFYQQRLGFRLIHRYDFNESKFSLYFLASLPADVKLPEPGTKESEKFLWTMPHQCVELTYNHGSEEDDSVKYASGNEEPHRGFGHLAVFADDVYKACDELEEHNVTFKKKPDEGRMKGLAFAYDPDGYWIEIIKRAESAACGRYTLAQTMLRVKDVTKSLDFYCNTLGMTLCHEKHFDADKGDFSLYFLAHLPEGTKYPDPKSAEAGAWIKTFDFPVLELTHNHGTETQDDFKYHSGNEDPKGFGHVAYIVDDLDATCAALEARAIQFKKKPSEGSMRGIAFAYDPDGYWVELVQRGLAM